MASERSAWPERTSFHAPCSAMDAVAWRDAVSRVGLTVQERQLPRGTVNVAKVEMTHEQRAEWCQQVAIKLVEDTIGANYEMRGTESVGPKIGEELMHNGILAVLALAFKPVIAKFAEGSKAAVAGALLASMNTAGGFLP